MILLSKLWRGSLHVGFTLLCLRFLVATGHEAGADLWPVATLILGSFGLAVWKPRAALFAFMLSVPLLTGLPYWGLAGCSPTLVFAAMWMGGVARRFRSAGARDQGASAALAGSTPGFYLIATDLLITALLLSIGIQLGQHGHEPDFWPFFFRQAVHGYSDANYFLTSGFIWLQGLFWFRILITGATIARVQAIAGTSGVNEPWRHHMVLLSWVRPLFLSIAVTMAVFAFVEYSSHLPEGWVGVGLQSPFKDIFSFGSMGVSVFVFTVTVQRKLSWPRMVMNGLYCLSLLGLVIMSWSRGTWLAAAVFLLVIATFRLPKGCAIITALVAMSLVVVINANANRPSWQNNTYLSRLAALVRVEKLADKSSGRFDLYHKAIGMIRERPVRGHGVGSFYLASPSYARNGDPAGAIPNFAHNTFLQIAAEQGVLTSALFATLVGCVLWKGLRSYRGAFGHHGAIASDRRTARERLTLLGTTLALGAYMQTNLTSNSLNIYVSNQFFFWFLMAALLTWPEARQEKAIAPDLLNAAGPG